MYGPHSKYYQKSSQLLNAMMEKQSTHFICIIYSGKYNSTILWTHGACIEELEQKQIKGPSNYSNPQHPNG